jgi:hypothetical protein
MSRLGELQTLFTQALLHNDDAVVSTIHGDGLEPAARLALYRHHVFETLTDVLKAAYPVVCCLVDERFFAYAADHYIRQQPPAGPCLFEYGESFPRFLAGFPACRALAYLPDVARLEWALHLAWSAEDTVPTNVESLRDLAPHELERVTFALDASVSYVSSPWPIDRIWRLHQPDADPHETVCLDAETVYLEVRRDENDDVLFHALEAGMFAFRSALAERRQLAEAFETAVSAAPDFCLVTALQTIFAEGLVVGIDACAEKEVQ